MNRPSRIGELTEWLKQIEEHELEQGYITEEQIAQEEAEADIREQVQNNVRESQFAGRRPLNRAERRAAARRK